MEERILVVEDDEVIRMTLGDRLNGEGYFVDFAADGEEGLRKATRDPYDLVILDVMLPRTSPSPPYAGRYTVASWFRCHSYECGSIVRGLRTVCCLAAPTS